MTAVDSSRKARNRRHSFLPLAGVAMLLGGCEARNWPVLYPDGPIAFVERELLFVAVALMVVVLVPVYLLTAWVLLRYRESADPSRYMPNWSYSGPVDAAIWLGPAVIVLGIGTLVWDYTHRLDPYREIASQEAPLEVQAVAQNWKWLFIYPGQDIAAVNELVLPVGRPVTIDITSDTVMNSFYVAGLAGQIYAMAGMRTKLNVLANNETTLTGRNTQYSGTGFSDQQFAVRAVPADQFESWIETVRAAPKTLDAAAYDVLAEPSQKVPVTYFSGTEPGLFEAIIAKYMGHAPGPGHAH